MIVELTDAGRSAIERLGMTGPAQLLETSLGEEVRKTSRRRTVRIPLDDGKECYLKCYSPGAGRAGKVARWRAPAEVEWRALHALQEEGFRVPTGLCALWTRRGDRGPSAILLAGVTGSRPLDEALQGAATAGAERWVLEHLPPWVRRFHDLGFQHRDLYACHLLVEDGWKGDPTLIDLARVRRSRRLSRRRRVKDLAALHYSLLPLLRPSLLLRLFSLYRGEPASTSGSLRLLRRVLKKSRRIAAHEPRWG